jgi:hypothetical protein
MHSVLIRRTSGRVKWLLGTILVLNSSTIYYIHGFEIKKKLPVPAMRFRCLFVGMPFIVKKKINSNLPTYSRSHSVCW